MDLFRPARAGDAAILASPRSVPAVAGTADGRQRVASSRSPDAVRPDLEDVFRREYHVVVAVAARVLGSRDDAEDVAQEVFVSFGRSSVPTAQARGWLCVAAAHGALNVIRSGRRRASREHVAATDQAVV